MSQTEYRRWKAVVNGCEYQTVAKTEKKARQNIRYRAAQNGLYWTRFEEIEVHEVV